MDTGAADILAADILSPAVEVGAADPCTQLAEAAITALRDFQVTISNTSSTQLHHNVRLGEHLAVAAVEIGHKVRRRERRLAAAVQYVHTDIDRLGGRLVIGLSNPHTHLDIIKGMMSDLNTLAMELGSARNAEKLIKEAEEIRYRFSRLMAAPSASGDTAKLRLHQPQLNARPRLNQRVSCPVENISQLHSLAPPGVCNVYQVKLPGDVPNSLNSVKHDSANLIQFSYSCVKHVSARLLQLARDNSRPLLLILLSLLLFLLLFVYLSRDLVSSASGQIGDILRDQKLVTESLGLVFGSNVGLIHHGIPPY